MSAHYPAQLARQTDLGLVALINHLAGHKNCDVVLLLCFKYIVRSGNVLKSLDLETCFFKGFSLRAREKALAVLEMTSW
jgi:hypothetical protein